MKAILNLGLSRDLADILALNPSREDVYKSSVGEHSIEIKESNYSISSYIYENVKDRNSDLTTLYKLLSLKV